MGAHGWTVESQPMNDGKTLFGVGVALAIVQIAFVAARFYTRYLQRVRCGVDDYIIFIALVCISSHYAIQDCGFDMVATGGKHREDHHPHCL